MILIAMSCLQGRTQDAAFDALADLGDGLQLTPGNLPSQGFRGRVDTWGGPTRLHHGFAWTAYRAEVYDADGSPLVELTGRSVHPPESVIDVEAWVERMVERSAVVEVMYPGHVLGTGEEVDMAMRAGLRLAVDISHLHIQEFRGVIDAGTVARLLDYDQIEEVHISQSDGRADQHRPLGDDVPHLAWAHERQRAGTVAVLESYFHRITDDERRRQVDRARA